MTLRLDEPAPSRARPPGRRAVALAALLLGLPSLAAADPGVPPASAAVLAGASVLLVAAGVLALVRRGARRAAAAPVPGRELGPAPGTGDPVGRNPEGERPLPSRDIGSSLDLITLPPGSDPFRRLVSTLEANGAVPETTVDVVEAIVASSSRGRDHETIGHSCRVARLAVALAERIGLRGETLTAIEWGALLHDVGKTTVPAELLDKPGPLAAEEMAVVRQHPRQGYQMLKHLVFLGPALDIVLSHHERWDGRGYPNGLAGDRIPLAARIFAVVDTYDAITSDRPYRAARGHAEAVAELQRVAGTQLDPRVVGRFLDIPETELRRLRARSEAQAPAPTPPAADEARDAEPAPGRRWSGHEAG